MRVTVTGGTGFLGEHVVGAFKANGHDVTPLDSKSDLRDARTAREALAGSEVVVHLAAKVGGIGANRQFPASFFLDNILMGVNVVDACHRLGVRRAVLCGTVCSYPLSPPAPFKEESLWDGYPEATNSAYGVAKRLLGEMANAYHRQYGLNYIYLLPTNMAGRGDNYKPESSHVLPAAIRKIDQALKTRSTPTFWGTGSATREFLNVRDAARAFVLAAESDYVGGPINLGSGTCLSIKEAVAKVADLMGYRGTVLWDPSKPDGQPHRHLDCSLAREVLGWRAEISFEDSLREMLADYRERFADV
jgi:GDP-L-fucose synthase